jgi:hypothetical protein
MVSLAACFDEERLRLVEDLDAARAAANDPQGTVDVAALQSASAPAF